MDCRQVQSKIADHSVGLLRAPEAEQLKGHLAGCAGCAREWREFQAVIGLVERHGSREPPPHLWNGVYNRITAEAPSATPGFWERLFGTPGWRIAGTATGLAAMALAASLYLYPGFSSHQDGMQLNLSPTAQSAVAVQQHAMLEGMEPFADEVGLEAYARLVNDSHVKSAAD